MSVRTSRFRWSALWRGIVSALSAGAGPTLPAVARSRGLHVCPECRRHRVSPLDWEPADDDHWLIALHCGECGADREAVATNAMAAVLDVALDRQQAAIERALLRLDAERMKGELEMFVRALDADLIDAGDFAR